MLDMMIVTSYFASPFHSNRAPYNEQLVASLKSKANIRLIRPISWLDILKAQRGLDNRAYYRGRWNDIEIRYPTFYFIPRIGHSFSGQLYYWSIRKAFAEFKSIPDVFFASWAYPDAYGVMKLAKRHSRPLVMSVLGSDINVLAKRPDTGKQVKEVLDYASAIYSPSNALSRCVVELGVAADKVHTVYSGIDGRLFFARDKQACEGELGLEANKKRLIYVGNFKVAKGVIDFVKGIQKLALERRDFEALIIGKGEDEALLRSAIADCGVSDIVRIVGEVNHHELNAWVNASDCLCLPSYSEGLPNVVLEALKTGTTVVATNVGGIPEAVREPEKYLFEPGDINALSQRLGSALFDPDYHTVAGFDIQSYDQVADQILSLTKAAIARSG